jgi:predicted permease
MSALLLLIVCLLLGAIVARIARPRPSMHQSLNWWVLNVAFPALVLDLIPRLHFDVDLWFLVVAMWIVFAGAWIAFAAAGRSLGWSRGRIGALTLTCGLGNTSFVGFPMIEALRGQEGLTLAVVADQLGCFVALAVGGIVVAALYSGRQASAREVIRRIALFPPFIALIVGVVVNLMGGWPTQIHGVLDRIGSTLVPLSLFSVGLQFRLRMERSQLSAMGIGLAWKLVLAPLLIFGIGTLVGIGHPVLVIGVLEAAMAPMISAAILADQYELEPSLANTVLGWGIVASLISVPIINHWL